MTERRRGGASSRGTQLEPFVVTSVLQLLCRTTKLCWYDDDTFRNIVEDAKRFLDKVSALCLRRVQCMRWCITW